AGLEPADVDAAANLGRVLPAGGQQTQPFGLGEATPHAVGLAGGQRVGGALGAHRAGPADGLGRALPAQAGRAPLTVRVEELSAVVAPARSVTLPVPHLCRRTRQTTHVGQGFLRLPYGR